MKLGWGLVGLGVVFGGFFVGDMLANYVFISELERAAGISFSLGYLLGIGFTFVFAVGFLYCGIRRLRRKM